MFSIMDQLDIKQFAWVYGLLAGRTENNKPERGNAL